MVRSVMQHDGVIIHHISTLKPVMDEDVVLRLHVDIRNTEVPFRNSIHLFLPCEVPW
jgi:hypothetical protein